MAVRIIVLVLYFAVLLAIGVYTSKMAKSYSEYNLAARSNNKWIAGISTQSSSTSGWMLLAMPGLAFTYGFGVIWTLIGWMGGSLFNWLVLAKRLRLATETYDSVSIVEYFEKRTGDEKGIVGLISGISIIVLMIINSSGELIGCGKLIQSAFGLDINTATTIGLVIVVIYTFLGGYMAVSWSNLLQGALMFIALLIVPIYAVINYGGFHDIAADAIQYDPDMFSFLSDEMTLQEKVVLVSGGVGIGFMYPGMVHALTGLMAIKDPKEVKDSALIATIWGCAALGGASMIGIAGRAILPDIADPEQTFLVLSEKYFNNALFALMAAAVMAAILSSVCAYLIVATASLGGSVVKRFFRIEDDHKVVMIEKIAMVVIALVAYYLAFNGGSVHTIAMFAASGLGASFGPVVIASLYGNSINWKGAVASIFSGMIVVIIWFYSGLSNYLFEVFPGWIVSTVALFAVSKATGGPDQEITENYKKYLNVLKN